jgi:energy-coupling factor transporter ATP-binding protein EcfA2
VTVLPELRARVTVLAGHYGSGKSTVALACAELLRSRFPDGRIALADLDIVNPYFRTADCGDALRKEGIGLIASGFASSNVDVPAMPGDAYRITGDPGLRVVVDVGGDDRGALALGRYAPALLAEGDLDMLGVINACRPLTRTPQDAAGVLREISAACGIPFTGLVNCTNLGRDTDAGTVVSGLAFAEKVAELTSVPVAFSAARRELCGALPDGMRVLPVSRIISHGGIENF